MIRNLVKNNDCQDCATSTVQPAEITDHQYSVTIYAIFLNHKNSSGMAWSKIIGLHKVAAAAEKHLNQDSSTQIKNVLKLVI